MSITRTLFGQTRSVPETPEEDWGPEVTEILSDLLEAADGITFRDADDNVGERLQSADTVVTAGATLTPTAPRHRLTAASALSLSASDAIADGTEDGQTLILEGTSDTNTVTVLDGANTDLNGLVILGDGECITLRWNETDSVWREESRSH